MVSLLTCNNEEDPIKMKALDCLQDYVLFFRRSRAVKPAVSGGNLPKFELIQAFMVVLVTCKNEEIPIKKGSRVLTRFYVFRRSRAANPAASSGIPPKFELI